MSVSVNRHSLNQTTRFYLKQLTNVELGLNPEPIHVFDEPIVHRVRTRREVAGPRFNAEQFPNIRAVEVVRNNTGFLVAEIAFAGLRFHGHYDGLKMSDSGVLYLGYIVYIPS